MANGYIVYRSVEDMGPMGDLMRYIKVDKPFPGETIYHGQFKPRQEDCGQYDANTRTVYDPVGEITKETYTGGSETF